MSDVMLLGVLRMPIPESPDPMTLRQFVSRARQAANRIEADGAELERLRAELAAERERCAKLCDEEHKRDDLTGDYRYGAGICAMRIRGA